MKLFIDIETIGTSDPAVIADIAAGITHPANISKAETIAAWEAEKKPFAVEEAVRKTSFDGGLGQVVCFGYAHEKGDAIALVHHDESQLLRNIAFFIPKDVTPIIIGHNVSWDIRFLWQRFIVNGLVAPKWLAGAARAKPWEIADTMLMWNPERERKISLDKLCKILRIPTPKSEMDGSMVWDAYRAGEIGKIATYCAGDVKAMRECYYRMAV